LDAKQRVQRLKVETFAAYGGAVCACCGDTHTEFLTIDHIDGGGAEHRRQLAKERGWKDTVPGTAMSGKQFYLWLRRNGYPSGFRVLCMNCNFSFGHFGYCPHRPR